MKPRSQTRDPDLKAEKNMGVELNTKSFQGSLNKYQGLVLTVIIRRIRHLEAFERKPIFQLISRAAVYLR